MKPLTLSAQQQRFCDEYLISANGKQAALAAGYSPKNAGKLAWQLLQQHAVKQYIADKQAALSEELNIKAEKVLQEYARIAFFDIRMLYDAEHKLLPLDELDPGDAAVIMGVEVYEKYVGNGAERAVAGRVVKVHLANKLHALDALAKHLGLFDKNNKQQQEDNGPYDVYVGDMLLSKT